VSNLIDKSQTQLDNPIIISLVSKNLSNIEEKELKRCLYCNSKHPSSKEKYFYFYLEL
jgi:hypothetical protein